MLLTFSITNDLCVSQTLQLSFNFCLGLGHLCAKALLNTD